MLKIKAEGATLFRYNIIFSIISSKYIHISRIRINSKKPGITDAEISFLRLIENITNGSKFFINETGTSVKMRPGFITGGVQLLQNCHKSRGLGYYLEPLLVLLPFARERTEIILNGQKNHYLDVSVDIIKTVYIPLLERFGLEEIDLVIKKGSVDLNALEQVKLTVIPVKNLKAINFTELGKIRRIRGLYHSQTFPYSFSKRICHVVRQILNQLLTDVWIYSDCQKNNTINANYGLSLIAESTTGSLLSVDHHATSTLTPEQFAESVACHLLYEISLNGYISSYIQPFVLILMSLTPEDVSKVTLGNLTDYSIEILRTLKFHFGVTFKLNELENGSILCSCTGTGFRNFIKQGF